MSTYLAHSFLVGNYVFRLDVQFETYWEDLGLKASSVPKVIFFMLFKRVGRRLMRTDYITYLSQALYPCQEMFEFKV